MKKEGIDASELDAINHNSCTANGDIDFNIKLDAETAGGAIADAAETVRTWGPIITQLLGFL